MRFVVVGVGAIGGVVGGRLHEHGNDVVLVARGEHGRVIAEEGLRVESVAGTSVVRAPVVAHPSEMRFTEGDVVLLATKTQDAEAALDAVAARASRSTPIVCLTNGVEAERLALRRFANVHAVCVMCPATYLEPGVVQAHSSPVSGLLDIGRYPSGHDDVTDAVAAALASSTFESIVRPDILRWKYAKLLMNLGNAAEALCDPTARQSDLVARARREGVACLRAAGIDVASREEDAERRGDRMTIGDVGGRPRGGGSTWQSLARGTGSIEVDHLNGEIVLLGRLHGVPTPVNETLQRLAHDAVDAGRGPGSMTPDEIEAVIATA